MDGKNTQKSSSSIDHIHSQKSKQLSALDHDYNVRNENLCVDCKDLLPYDGNSIQCELSDSWYCVPCSGITHTFYQELLSEENNGNCIWYCNGCKKAIPGVRKVLNMVSLIKKIHRIQ
ncbi:hypothetical protein DPMN_009889 [Dreissena polymorpha]|uniref:PHD-type domain-containing protein n=1 Tax=Dreissena polymorpha TaxID=45954 RepID=A0A9D4N0G9_DREPO|nr:hypothetical protein DPMN_009889 [Dreissena polymorpha]